MGNQAEYLGLEAALGPDLDGYLAITNTHSGTDGGGHTRSHCSWQSSAHCKCKEPYDNALPELYLFSNSSLTRMYARKIVHQNNRSFIKTIFYHIELVNFCSELTNPFYVRKKNKKLLCEWKE